MVLDHLTAAVAQNGQAASRIAALSASIGRFPGAVPMPPAVDPRISKVTGLMHRTMHRTFRLRDLAGATGLSVSRLCHLFQNQTGTSLRRYLKAARLANGRELLETSSFSVKEVGARAGFNHVGRFIGDFRRTYGATPPQFRRGMRRNSFGLTTEN